MSLEYRIYGNGGSGGGVDYTTVLDTTASLTWTSPALSDGTDWTFVVRAHDTVSDLEDEEADTRARVVIAADGSDATNWPLPPSGVTVKARAGGGAKVIWQHPFSPSGKAPSGFHVYSGTPIVSYSAPAATVAYSPNDPARTYSALLSGLSDGSAYQVVVRAFNGSGEEPNTTVVSVTGRASGPAPVVSLTASVVP